MLLSIDTLSYQSLPPNSSQLKIAQLGWVGNEKICQKTWPFRVPQAVMKYRIVWNPSGTGSCVPEDLHCCSARPPISAEFLVEVECAEALYYDTPEIQNSAEIGDLAGQSSPIH